MSKRIVSFARLRAFLLAGSACAAFASTIAVAKAQDGSSDKVEKVVVTGSRIKRSNTTSVNPLQIIDARKIELQSPATISDIFLELPQVGMQSNFQSTTSALVSPGFSNVDLRNLGAEKTLVLVNGRRHVNGAFDNPTVDLGSIPVTLIDRIEVITGGASAVYGADGVAGVVNIILKRNLEGVVVDAQVGSTTEGDGEEWRASAALGGTFGEGRGYGTFGLEFANIDEIRQTDRDWSQQALAFFPPLGGGNPQVPARGVRTLVNNNAGLDHTLTSTLAPADQFNTIINPAGAPVRVPKECSALWANPNSGERRRCAFDQLGSLAGLFTNAQIFNMLQTPSERAVVYSQMEWDFNSSLTAFAEGSWTRVEVDTFASPSFFSGRSTALNPFQANSSTGIRIFRDNVFLTPAILDEMNAAGIPAGPTGFTTLNMLTDELGGRTRTTDRNTTRLVAGLKGDFEVFDHPFEFETYYQYGNSRSDSVSRGDIQLRTRLAIDSVADVANGGVAVCRHELNVPIALRTCVPYNWVTGPSALAAAFALPGPIVSATEIQQQVASAVVTTEAWSLWAEPIGLAAGLEWREELTRFTSDASTQNAQSFFNEIFPVNDGYDVQEAFAEIRVPVVSGGFLAEYLAFDGAIRGSTYSNTGYATSWKLGAEWAPTVDVRFRGTLATAQRSPNGFELFSQAANFAQLNDPCDALQVGGGTAPATRLANCTTLLSGIAGGYNPATFASNLRSATARLIQSGNRNLRQEEAETVTFGAVVTPRWIDNFVVSADYYFIEMVDGISTLAGQTVLNGCVDTVGFDPFFCGFINRRTGPTDDGGVTSVGAPFVNNAVLTAEGYDINVAYRFDVADLIGGNDMGSVSVDLAASHMLESSAQPSPTTPALDTAGYVSDPYWRGNGSVTWAIDDLSFGWQVQYIHELRLDVTQSPATRNPFYVDAWMTHDFQVKWQASENFTARLGVNNAFNEIPPQIPTINTAVGIGGSAYDNRGTFVYLGLGVQY